jgi:asparagine synthase (glutamine-hydrolysing)
MQKQISEPVKTFSVGYREENEGYSELPFAKIVSSYLETQHYEINMNGTDFGRLITRYIWHQEQPLADASLIPYYFISEYASKYVKVMLSGVGGDEFFFGYSDMRLAKINVQLNSFLPIDKSIRQDIVELYRNSLIPPGILRGFLRLVFFPIHNYILPRYFESRHKKALYSDDFSKTVGHDHTDSVIKNVLLQAPPNCNAYQKALYVYVKTWLATNMLQGTDKVTMASSLEQRVPLLDHKLIEHAANIPYHYLFQSHRYKNVLKKAVAAELPDIIINRKKMGFVTPEIPWLTKNLKDTIKSTLLDKKCLQRGYFYPEAIENLTRDFEKKDHSLIRRVWLLYNLELWHRIFIDNETPTE